MSSTDLQGDDNVNMEERALLTQITHEKETAYEQYAIYLLNEISQNAPISELYQLLKRDDPPIDASYKDLDASLIFM